VSRSWAEFLGDREDAPAEDEETQRGWFGRLRESLSASRQALTRELLFDPGDDEAWERIEEALIAADCGVPATVEIVPRPGEPGPAWGEAPSSAASVRRAPGTVSASGRGASNVASADGASIPGASIEVAASGLSER